MRKRSRFMGVLAVGALAVGVSVYAAPRTDGTVRAESKASRLVIGAVDHLQDAIEGGAAGGASYVGIRGINPANGGAYGAGVTLAGGAFSLNGANARLWFGLFLGGWGGELTIWQIAIDQGAFNNGVGADLAKPVEACTDNADCIAVYGAGSKCTAGVCDVGFQDTTNPRLAINGINAVNQATLTYGSTVLPLSPGENDDFAEYYGGVLVLDANGARGLYNVQALTTAATFLTVSGTEILINTYFGTTVNVPEGQCCQPGDVCDDGVTELECNNLGGFLFTAGSTCAAPCAQCLNPGGPDPQCDDGDACTDEICTAALTCQYTPTFNTATECCNGSTGDVAGKDDGDDCTDDFCDGSGAFSDRNGRPASTAGAPAHVPSAPGAPCNDGNACTFADECDGVGGCAGTDANTVPCTTDDDCLAATGGALECQESGFCFCTLSPPLTVDITPSDAVDPNCFDDGEKVLATVHVGPSLDVITGGELAIVYGDCMDLQEVILLPPFNNILFIDSSVPGELYIAVGIDLGGVGVAGGNFDLLGLSFIKKGGCDACNICFTDANPRHTRLTNDVGQVVTLQPECSKDIRGDGVLSMDTPDTEKVNTECGKASAEVTWANPTAADTCLLTDFWCGGLYQNAYTGEVVDVSEIGVDPYGGGRFPIGASTFCCNAANDCGETVRECWTVQVNDQTSLDVDIALSPTMAAAPGTGLTRCIKFEVFSNCSTEPIVFSENVTFGGLFDLAGKVQTSVKIPTAGQFGCITARDQLHTLRSCYTFGAEDCDADGVLHATFKGDPFFGGNWLVGGNLDGYKKDSQTASLNVIDITDFGMFVSQYPNDYGTGNTPCGTDGPHADINGDGLVDLLDFTFITMNFLEDSKDCCCPGSAAGEKLFRTSISARVAGMAEADINADGIVNMEDMALFLEGYQKPAKTPRAHRGLR